MRSAIFLLALLTGGHAAAQTAVPMTTFGEEGARLFTARVNTGGTSPLRVKLIEPPRKPYRRLDVVPFEISIENISDRDIVLPWSAVHIFVGPSGSLPRGYKRLAFDFIFLRRGKPDWVLATLELTGSNGSKSGEAFKTLRPGEQVVVKAPVPLVPSADRNAFDPLLQPGSGRVKLVLRFESPDDPMTASFGSRYADNTVRLELAPTVAAIQPTPATNLPPSIVRVRPDVVSPGMAIRIEGYRLGAERFGNRGDKPRGRYFFLNGDTRVAATTGPYTTPIGNPDVVGQVVTLTVPDTLSPGSWTVVAQVDGVESKSAVPVTVTEWVPPRLDHLAPERVNPGGSISIAGKYFRPSDSVSGLDPSGKFDLLQKTTSSADSVSFIVPADAVEGTHTVRVQTFRPGARVGTPAQESLSYVVDYKPLAPVLRSRTDYAFGIGQWIVIEGTRPFSWSDNTEIEFTQGATRVVTKPATPKAGRVRIPSGLTAGEVTVRARIFHDGIPSDWSAPVEYRIAVAPAPPTITVVYVGRLEQPVPLSGATPARRFDVSASDRVNMSGFWPIDFDAVIPVILKHGNESVPVTTKRNQTNVVFTLPANVKGGPWTITTGAVDGTPEFTLPAMMYVR